MATTDGGSGACAAQPGDSVGSAGVSEGRVQGLAPATSRTDGSARLLRTRLVREDPRVQESPPSQRLPILVRSWNVFHGNAYPPDRRSRLEAMVRLATADRPDVLCLQEVPPWALEKLAGWSGMTARWVVTREPRLPGPLAGVVTRLNNGYFRSGLSGQANAILLASGREPRAHRSIRIDDERHEPRYCHAVRLQTLVVGNLHATTDIRNPRVPAAEIVRAEAFVSDVAAGLPCVLAGDFNLRAEHLADLPGWSELGPGIDHVLVRGLAASRLMNWPEERRRQNGTVLSDHAPVEVTVG
jgi:endonuclease/exonuclease/phosphatase family metal-dependent hydrolase